MSSRSVAPTCVWAIAAADLARAARLANGRAWEKSGGRLAADTAFTFRLAQQSFAGVFNYDAKRLGVLDLDSDFSRSEPIEMIE